MSHRNRMLFAIAALALVVAACPAKDAGEKQEDKRPIETETVKTGDAVREVSVVGTLEGANEVQIFSQIPERIISLTVKEGDKVRQGKVLAILAMDVQSSQVKQAGAALAAAEASRDSLAEEVDRLRKLVQAGAAPQQQLDSLESQLRATEAQVAQTATGLSAASVQRRRAVITAPISGKVASLAVKKGDTATPGRPLMTIVQGQSVKAVFQVPEREFLRIRQAMPATLSPLGGDQLELATSVTVMGSVVDRRTRTGLVEMHLDNIEGRLVPGSAVRARIELERRPNVVLVPAAAVLLTATSDIDGRALVFVEEGGRVKKLDVTIGERQGGKIEIKDGLTPGQHLVVKGQHLLRDGAAVEVVQHHEREPDNKPSTVADAAPPAKEGDGT